MTKSEIFTGFAATFAAMAFIIPMPASAATEGDVIKIACAEGSDVSDSCRSVYYLGLDGERHAFPNQEVYNSWYDDFGNVVEIDEAEMNELPVGENVTLKPGVMIVKFSTDDAIYAVDKGGVLRHYLTTSLVTADYGGDWAERDLLTMPDMLFDDYTVGEEIDSEDDYDPAEAEKAVTSIDDNF